MRAWIRLAVMAALTLALFSPAKAQAADADWLRYPALSPDGKTLAFCYQGDIFRVSIDGGDAVPLTRHEAYDYAPCWSPDGKQLAFSSSRHGNFDVFVMDAGGGAPRRLTVNSAGDSVAGWTPDGKNILFLSARFSSATTAHFPSGILTEIWSVPAAGGRAVPYLQCAARHAHVSPDGASLLYVRRTGYEDYWRKHQRASQCDDIWLCDIATGTHARLTAFEGDDNEPEWLPDGKRFYFLSDRDGASNIWVCDRDGGNAVPLTRQTAADGTIRFLSLSADGATLVYCIDGNLFRCDPRTGESRRIAIRMNADSGGNAVEHVTLNKGASEFAVSPNGKEVAFIVRGDVFAATLGKESKETYTKALTRTPGQERSVSWSPDGKKIIYASERGDSWNLYETARVREEETTFARATLLKETPILEDAEETFQPVYSPDGKEVAYISERTALKIVNRETRQTRVICEYLGYSYTDGDFTFDWSPDGKWIVHDYMPPLRWSNDIAISAADGSGTRNITQSGYEEGYPLWSQDGRQIFFRSDRDGLRAHGSWGNDWDVYGVFVARKDHEEFLSKDVDELAEAEGDKEKEEDPDKDNPEKPDKPKRRRKGGDRESSAQEPEPEKPADTGDGEAPADGEQETEEEKKEPVVVVMDFPDIEERVRRVSAASMPGAAFAAAPDGKRVVFFSPNAEDKFDLWITDPKKQETKILVPLGQESPGDLQWDTEGKFVYFTGEGGSLNRVDPDSGDVKKIAFAAEMDIDYAAERAAMFEHIWRQTLKKFYDPGMHGVDWAAIKQRYIRYLPSITEDRDFAEMTSEMLGELNASHTGCRYRGESKDGDQTAQLGLLWDYTYAGDGLNIAEIVKNGPCDLIELGLTTDDLVYAIDEQPIRAGEEWEHLLNRKAGKKTVLTVGKAGDTPEQRRQIIVKPVDGGPMGELLYQRWVRRSEETVKRLSEGKIGYVHVRGMNQRSFRDVFLKLFGEYSRCEAVILDTRFNGGGWLHDDLCTMLTGREYCYFTPRGVPQGGEPIWRWTRQSLVITNEANYSDAHFFPYSYQALNIGTTLGMPVPGTATAVWWEKLINGTLTFGIPQVGVRALNGNYLENQNFQPDIVVENNPGEELRGTDKQGEEAVRVLQKKK